MKWLKFAILSVLRNRRRTFATILITAVGTAAILIGGGFALYTYESLREMAARDNGHLILAHADYFSKQEEIPLEFGLQDQAEIVAKLIHDPRIRAVLPRLDFSGLISNGDRSSVFIGRGINQEEFKVKGPFFTVQSGSTFSRIVAEDTDPQIMIGSGLAKIMNAKAGDELTLLSTTVEGALNAQDVIVQGIFSLGTPEIDKRIILTNLDTAQQLLVTDKVSTLSAYLYDTDKTNSVGKDIAAMLPALDSQTWLDQAFYYLAVKGLYNRIFGLMGIIILAIVFFAVSNTMSISVIERTREIGTLRAMGTHNREIERNFVLEAAVIGIIGVSLGILIALAVATFFYLAGLEMPPPPARSQGYPLAVNIDPILYCITAISILTLCITAAWFSARRAVNKPIVEALAHV